MFLWSLHQNAAESPNGSTIFATDSAGFFVLRFIQCGICVALAHSKRARVSPTKNEAGATFPLVSLFATLWGQPFLSVSEWPLCPRLSQLSTGTQQQGAGSAVVCSGPTNKTEPLKFA
jgi:hypothetical protein